MGFCFSKPKVIYKEPMIKIKRDTSLDYQYYYCE